MPATADYAALIIRLRKWNVADQMLFWTALYCVKLSFMFLYKYVLGSIRPNVVKTWYLALVYIVCCYGICLIGVFGQCGDARNLWSVEGCSTSYVTALDQKIIWIDFFFNVSSDLIGMFSQSSCHYHPSFPIGCRPTYPLLVVVLLPMPVIWSLHMTSTQKLAVSSICSLAIITVVFEIVRTVKLYQNNFNLTNLYSYLELLVAVIISILPSFRFMVSPSPKDREYRRLFWTAITWRSMHSNSSGYSMHSYDQVSRQNASSRQINVQTTIDQQNQEISRLSTQGKV